ncbi:hypothetical protein RHGRI_038536 [Rhododendron griersonianum]|uniref:Uncharacterized protein n=1 Tax=Rhododendron griersonianum TaxID=479676 RepID=A0AAV6HPH9_9ERIC|nr:hypothetical protein RHGRI_038536 [Rhododendron griersonianum]
MADGTISLAEGLGLKALDSNELRRRQQVLDPSKSPHFLPSPMKVGTQQGAIQVTPVRVSISEMMFTHPIQVGLRFPTLKRLSSQVLQGSCSRSSRRPW